MLIPALVLFKHKDAVRITALGRLSKIPGKEALKASPRPSRNAGTSSPIEREKQHPSCLLPIDSCLLPFAYCLLPFAFCLLPFAFCLLPFAFCLLPIAFCLLPFAYCLLPFASCLLPFAFCLLPFAFCLLPFAFCLLPFASPPHPGICSTSSPKTSFLIKGNFTNNSLTPSTSSCLVL